ncbi:MAG: hypothetical protein R2744_01580 [Bacteroidales bacterium]
MATAISFAAPGGRLEVLFGFVGYGTSSRSITVPADDTITVNIGLIPVVNEINEIVVSAGKSE